MHWAKRFRRSAPRMPEVISSMPAIAHKSNYCETCCRAWRGTARGGQEGMEGLSSWSLLGAVLAALVGFGAYVYGGLDARGADQAGVGEYVIPKLQVAHLTQPSEGLSQSTKNSSSSTEAAEYTLSAE